MGSSWFRNAEKIKKKKIAVTALFLCFNRSKKYSDTETLKMATKNLKF